MRLSIGCETKTCLAGTACGCAGLVAEKRCYMCRYSAQQQEQHPFIALLDDAVKQCANSESIADAPNERETTVDDLLYNLRQKLDAGETAVGELEDKLAELRDVKEEIETFNADLADLIASIESVPEVSVSVDGFDFDSADV